ncbi:MAG TPA: glycosyltransferase [Bacteroidota bacterium]|nr:glycosyltransferase [Bacteroidota bacterium]
MNETILFFYLRTGGGHLAPVRALADCMRERYPGRIEPVLIDGMAKAGRFARFVIEDGYRITQARAKWIYELAYAAMKFHPATRANSVIVARLLRPGIEETILTRRPRGIVVSHFFLIAPILDILRKRGLSIPVITIVTDPYTAHPLWFLRSGQAMVAFSEKVKESAVRLGVSSETVHVFPFILDPKFSRSEARSDAGPLKAEFGFRHDQRVILLLGGGDGMPRGFRIAKEILNNLPGFGVVLVCGKDKSLFRKAGRLASSTGGRDLKVFAYVENVPDLLKLSDAVITKGGASTVMEIIALGKTPIITSYIWEQEKGNVEFIVNDSRGIYEKRIRMLPAVLSGIFEDAPPYRRIRERNRDSMIESGTPAVAEFIMRFAGLEQSPGREG